MICRIACAFAALVLGFTAAPADAAPLFRASTAAEILWARDHFNPAPPFFLDNCRTHRRPRNVFHCNGLGGYYVQSRQGQSLFPARVR